MLTANFTDNVKNMPRQGLQKRTIEGVSVARFERRLAGGGWGGVADISGSRVCVGLRLVMACFAREQYSRRAAKFARP